MKLTYNYPLILKFFLGLIIFAVLGCFVLTKIIWNQLDKLSIILSTYKKQQKKQKKCRYKATLKINLTCFIAEFEKNKRACLKYFKI